MTGVLSTWQDRETVLVLGGGNALGAYHLGVCESLFGSGLHPEWVLGTSIGAITAAIITGNPPERAVSGLTAFWRQAAEVDVPGVEAFAEPFRARINNWFALSALVLGRPGLFHPRLPGLLSLLPGTPPDRAIGDHRAIGRTLERLVDFDRLNDGPHRLSINALDMETGEEVWFDTTRDRIGPEHILASAAFVPMFPPVEIDGRLLCDAGFANNLPVDRVFAEPAARDRLCIASDLFNIRHGRPRTLDEAVVRVQDLAFASQSRRSLDAILRERNDAGRADPSAPGATIAYLTYRAAGHERTLKSLDFSTRTLTERARQGKADMSAMLGLLSRTQRDAGTVLLELEQDR